MNLIGSINILGNYREPKLLVFQESVNYCLPSSRNAKSASCISFIELAKLSVVGGGGDKFKWL